MSVSTPEVRLKQGAHPDPLDKTRPTLQPHPWASSDMQAFRAALVAPEAEGTRAGVLDDLSAYYKMTPEECVERCINWEAWSVQEWKSTRRDSPEGLAEFYKTIQSWSFDLLWYAYLQAEGVAYPVGVVIAGSLPGRRPGARHLDFGSGVGVTSQLFARLGYETELADVSTSLLAFARFRLERRGEAATYIDLNTTGLGVARYDVITAVDTLVHVPDLKATAQMLHRAIRPGGYLFANFDVRPRTDENAWHLYEDDLPLRWQLQRVGFEPEETLDGMVTRYRRVDSTGLAHSARGVRDTVLLRSPLRRIVRTARARLRQLRRAA
jgi:2-polyprenyl-3-methyl-5-hydroxy-6-metoxy-1,4-benzoquinol methylase